MSLDNKIQEMIAGDYYAHLGRVSITIWNNKGTLSVPRTKANVKLIFEDHTPLAEPHLEAVEKKKYFTKSGSFKFYNLRKTALQFSE